MKIVRTIMLLIAIPALSSAVFAEEKSYPLTLEVISYSSVGNGYYAAPRQNFNFGTTTISTGGSMTPLTTMTSSAILITPTGKIRCTLWNRKHYLTVDTYHARQIAPDQLEVIVQMKKGKQARWRFKIISAEKLTSGQAEGDNLN